MLHCCVVLSAGHRKEGVSRRLQAYTNICSCCRTNRKRMSVCLSVSIASASGHVTPQHSSISSKNRDGLAAYFLYYFPAQTPDHAVWLFRRYTGNSKLISRMSSILEDLECWTMQNKRVKKVGILHSILFKEVVIFRIHEFIIVSNILFWIKVGLCHP